MLLDTWMPDPEFSSGHWLVVPAPPATVFEAALRADLSRPILVRFLMGLRALPGMLRRPRRMDRPRSLPPFETRTLMGIEFTVLDREPGREIVLGLEGAFWERSGGLRRLAPEAFKGPVALGAARAVWNFSVEPHPDGAMLRTATRVRCGDARSRNRFGRYWTVVAPGSGIIRRLILREVRREALRAA